ncbi:hypothetical protein [Leptospira levettii]|uniref:hypothetical protein n=2 Tax=Leptospira levettii TaxID=2023178 RepID=UPI0010829E61|nr:hypothetical protein [Leptospira levettii]MCW7507940.1 hypothetical protein [Leptospira levettii]MCW7519030.1 hypothetical protein [Leptospira levettii]TGK98629.1 hypothetical protein EHQ34_10195 [Leptospira levettii]
MKRLIIFFLITMQLNFPVDVYASIGKKKCDIFHKGIFSYSIDLGELIVVRNEWEEVSYRVYPDKFIKSSIKWISPCVAEYKVLEVKDELFNADFVKKIYSSRSYLHITEIFADGYSYKLTDSKFPEVYYGKAKYYKKPLGTQ